jgi:gas vesicle protein
MKYEKIISKILAKKTDNSGQVAVAVVAGLAAGAIISILFAPESGANSRKAIAHKAKDLGNGIKNSYSSLKDRILGVEEEIAVPESPYFVHSTTKRKKSNIKEVINDFHNGEHHNEQPIG